MNSLNRSDLQTRDGLSYLSAPGMARIPWVRHGFLARRGGMSPPPYDTLNLGGIEMGDLSENISGNRDLIAAAFGFDRDRLLTVHQKHQDGILVLREPFSPPPAPVECDAMVTDVPNLFLGIRTADCVPILVADPEKGVIAAIHAGRSGTALCITAKTLRAMEDQFGCSTRNLQIATGPSIGSCCYEIGEAVFQPEWNPFSRFCGGGKWRVDLAAINIHQMKKEGVPEDQIERIDLCTRCNSDLFFSYRKETRTGRQLSFIGKAQ
jgi:polyphenol oxidase